MSFCYALDMPKEVPLQIDMFTNDLVDTRTARQKRQAKKSAAPQQFEMFSQRDIAQFGVTARPKMPLPEGATMALIIQDPRTPEQVELDRQRAAEALNGHLFTNPEPDPQLNRKRQSVPGRGPLSETLPTSLTFFVLHNCNYIKSSNRSEI